MLADLSHELAPVEGRRLTSDALRSEDSGGQGLPNDGGGTVIATKERGDSAGIESDARSFGQPPMAEGVGILVLLRWSGRQARGLRGRRTRDSSVLQCPLDLVPPLGEHPQHLTWDPLDLGEARLDVCPGNAEPPGQLCAQHRLIEVRHRRRLADHRLRVQRRPAPVDATDDVGDDDVRVQLRVQQPRRVVVERGTDEPRGRDAPSTTSVALVASGGASRQPLQHLERLPDRSSMGGRYLLCHGDVAQGVEHGYRRRSRARDVEADPAGVVGLSLVVTPHHGRD